MPPSRGDLLPMKNKTQLQRLKELRKRIESQMDEAVMAKMTVEGMTRDPLECQPFIPKEILISQKALDRVNREQQQPRKPYLLRREDQDRLGIPLRFSKTLPLLSKEAQSVLPRPIVLKLDRALLKMLCLPTKAKPHCPKPPRPRRQPGPRPT